MKRFTETGKWGDPWFMGLSLDAKLAFWFIIENCDAAGVWDPNYRLANFCFQRDIDWDAVRNELGARVEVLQNGKWWLPKYVGFQCGKLSSDCPPHRKVLDILSSNGLSERVVKGYIKGSNSGKGKATLQEEEEEEEEEEGVKGEIAERRVIPPKPEWVAAYSLSIGYPLDGRAWCDAYAQKGWMVGKSRMKDWQAAVRNWKTNGWKPDGGAGKANPQQRPAHTVERLYAEPNGWRAVAQETLSGELIEKIRDGLPWLEVPISVRAMIAEAREKA